MKYKTKLKNIDYTFLGILAIFAITVETVGRKLFLVYDGNISIYATQFWIDNQEPFNPVSIGWDWLLGGFGIISGDAELAVWILGLAINTITTIVIYLIGRSCNASRLACLTASTATALWLCPPLGGWSGDHLSFLVGILPAFLLIINGFEWKRWMNITAGASIAYGLTLKLNSYLPTLATTLFFIGILSIAEAIALKRINMQKLAINACVVFTSTAISSVLISEIITNSPLHLYAAIFNFYSDIAGSDMASSRLSLDRLLLFPLHQNFFEAFVKSQKSVVAFSPIAASFWLSILYCMIGIIKDLKKSRLAYEEKIEHSRHYLVVLLFLFSSAICSATLGRPLSNRLFIMPAGIIYCVDIFLRQRGYQKSNYIFTGIIGYLAAVWLGLAFMEYNSAKTYMNEDGAYNVGTLFDDKSKKPKLCIDVNKKLNNGINLKDESILFAHPELEAAKLMGASVKCWNQEQFSNNFAGLGWVYDIANFMGTTYSNQVGYRGQDSWLFELWDKTLTTEEGRAAWTNRQAKIINSNKLPYLIEDLDIRFQNEKAKTWSKDRQKQKNNLMEQLGAKKIGHIGFRNIWSTKWARDLQ